MVITAKQVQEFVEMAGMTPLLQQEGDDLRSENRPIHINGCRMSDGWHLPKGLT
jgi:hypothetical protein